MDARIFNDVLKYTIDALHLAMPDVWVGDQLPAADEMQKNLPVVMVDLLPGEELWAWGGKTPVRDFIELDLDVFSHNRASATTTAMVVRDVIHGLPFMAESPVVQVECPGFTTRTDFNPRIRRIGTVARLIVEIDPQRV